MSSLCSSHHLSPVVCDSINTTLCCRSASHARRRASPSSSGAQSVHSVAATSAPNVSARSVEVSSNIYSVACFETRVGSPICDSSLPTHKVEN